MNRSGYSDDIDDPLAFGRWRGAVSKAIDLDGQRWYHVRLWARNNLKEVKK